MTRLSFPRARTVYTGAILVTTTLGGLPLLAAAQQATVSAELVEMSPTFEVPALPTERRQVGDATRHLLDMQREGRAASPTPRPLAGEIASLSYQRYLDSFKFPIPERFNTTVQKTGAAR